MTHETFFPDPQVAASVCGPESLGARRHMETLWKRFRPYADRNFLHQVWDAANAIHRSADIEPARTKALDQLRQRYWEMYVGCGLLSRGLSLTPYSNRPQSGPDHLVHLAQRRLWIECVAPGSGNSVDAVPDYVDKGVHEVPDEAIKLRYLAAVGEKRKKYASYRAKGLIDANDLYIIALSGAAVRSSHIDYPPPRIVRALLGVGSPAVDYRPDTREWSESYLTSVGHIRKSSGATVDTTIFLSGQSRELVGVLFSSVDAWNRVGARGRDFVYVENPTSDSKLDRGWLPRCVYYYLTKIDGKTAIANEQH